MAKYSYPAVFTEEEVGGYSVSFPDIESCFTQGEDMTDAMEMAADALCLILYDMEKNNREIPPPTDIKAIKTAENEIVSYVYCDTMFYKKFFENKSVKKTLSIPSWLNEKAEAEHINFSSVLQSALKERLNLN
ncbi:MAG: type II toxin-antitoxin system HicB family antitoxin [Prevotella sp.]|nr:type II toxin-antitoxin system HicB family antitoxin [Prevotella sp.]